MHFLVFYAVYRGIPRWFDLTITTYASKETSNMQWPSGGYGLLLPVSKASLLVYSALSTFNRKDINKTKQKSNIRHYDDRIYNQASLFSTHHVPP